MGIGCIDSESQCFESGGGVVIGEVSLELLTHVVGGGVSYGFVEVDNLSGESIEGGALFVCFNEVSSSGC